MGFWEEIGDAPIKENDPFNLGGILKLAKGLGAVGSGGFGAKKIVDAAKKFWEEIGDAPMKEADPAILNNIKKIGKKVGSKVKSIGKKVGKKVAHFFKHIFGDAA